MVEARGRDAGASRPLIRFRQIRVIILLIPHDPVDRAAPFMDGQYGRVK
jgi:hypothetical protein